MTERIAGPEIYRLQPAIPRALGALGDAAVKAGLEHSLIELVKLRASQINGCAFCVNMHSRDARKLGESQERLDLLPVWRESPCFTPREQAALAWTEALTLIARDHVPHEVYAQAQAQFAEAELVNLAAAVIAINGWNRIAVTFRLEPPVVAPAAAAA
jgi:AhpD family alkylhydroperoxidase